MPNRVINPISVMPADLQDGDVMLFVVKAVVHIRNGEHTFVLYRCNPITGIPDDEIPQGMRLFDNVPLRSIFHPINNALFTSE